MEAEKRGGGGRGGDRVFRRVEGALLKFESGLFSKSPRLPRKNDRSEGREGGQIPSKETVVSGQGVEGAGSGAVPRR